MVKTPQLIGTGRRKTSIARVYISPSSEGKIIVNKKNSIEETLHRKDLIEAALKPLRILKQIKNWDIIINIKGGGLRGQAEAISLGIARALLQSDEKHRPILREHNLLTRDSRMVERKKYGQPGARKQFQFSKR